MTRLRLVAGGLGLVLMLASAASCSANPQPPVHGEASEPLAAPIPPAVSSPSSEENFKVESLEYSGEQTQGGWIRGAVPTGVTSITFDKNSVNIGPDGTFFIAFDRNSGPSARLSARWAYGRSVTRDIKISPRAWKIEHVNVARRRSGPSAAFMKLRRPELARINAARSLDTGSTGWQQDFIWPVRGRISGRFGSQQIYRGTPGSYHSGVDIATGASGTPFVAPADGTVILAADKSFTLEGKLLMIDHGMGLNSAFLHCSALLVKEGDQVKKGQVVGRIGSTGRATGPHLHWGMKWNRSRIDPILLVGPMPR